VNELTEELKECMRLKDNYKMEKGHKGNLIKVTKTR
jgi:hypothetical protein